MAKLNLFKTIFDFLDNSARISPDKVGLIFENREYTYKEIKERVNDVSCLLAVKAKRGDIIALLSSNVPEMIFCYFGILGAGCIVLLLSSNISDENLIMQINKIKPKFIFSHRKYKSKLERAGIIKKIEFFDIENIPVAKREICHKNIKENDISTIIFTSGTTTEPKGVMLRHSNVVNATKNIIEFLKWGPNDIDVNILSLSHSFGLGNIHCIFAVGGTVILFRDAINLKEIISVIINKKATTFAAVPATLRLIINNYSADFKKCDKYLRFIQTNTSPLDAKIIKEIMATLPNVDFNYYYGLTEASRSTFIALNKHLDKLNSVGEASPNVELKIVNSYGRKVAAEKIGEICIKGKHVVKDYWENPKAENKIKDGWLYTNDAGYLDKKGYLYFKGRKDDIINVSGEKVMPEEIENMVRKIPGVDDAAAIGAPDKLLGEVVKVFISVNKPDFKKEIVIKECRKKLESHKVPRAVEIVPRIPRTENGKLRRAVLK